MYVKVYKYKSNHWSNTQPSEGSEERRLTSWCSYGRVTALQSCNSSMLFSLGGVWWCRTTRLLLIGQPKHRAHLLLQVHASPEEVLKSATFWLKGTKGTLELATFLATLIDIKLTLVRMGN